jgi:Flp pilus assembly protein TadD
MANITIANRPALAGAMENQRAGRVEEAEAGYRRVLAISPDHAEAHNDLGNLLQDQGRLEEALVSYRRTVEIAPKHLLA